MRSRHTEWAKAEAKGWHRFDNADFQGALHAWSDAAYALEATPENTRDVATSLQHVALAHAKLGNLQAAVRHLERALREHYAAPPPTTQEDHRFRAECLLRLGSCCAELGEEHRAVECLARACRVAERSEDDELVADCLAAWGFAIEAEGDLLSALNILSRARTTAQRLGRGSKPQERVDRAIRDLLVELSRL
jgi:tetratricopeptide (TPR) repeat protein